MAESAAHASTSAQANPTVFEVVAQESLISSLEGSIKVLFEVIYSKNPRKFGWLLKWYDEIYLCLNWFLQHHYLKTCDASFSEAFYNLRRLSLKNPEAGSLSKSETYKSLFVLVALPYIDSKLKMYMDKWATECTSFDPKKREMYERWLQVYKYFGMSYETLKMIHILRYMTSSSKTHTPLLVLAGVQLVYQTDTSKKFPDFRWMDLLLSPFRKSSNIPNFKSVLLRMFCQGLEFSAFFIQFLKWWQTEDMRSKMSIAPVPKPPHSRIEKNSLVAKGLCPICQRRRRVEVVLQTSGYVFCYKCIIEVLNATGKCPVSGLPSSSLDLVRLYEAS